MANYLRLMSANQVAIKSMALSAPKRLRSIKFMSAVDRKVDLQNQRGFMSALRSFRATQSTMIQAMFISALWHLLTQNKAQQLTLIAPLMPCSHGCE